ncbi:RNA-guided endonuclease InsQ/TnpB family protein [Fischerella thermalis]|uniref:RNA-guided endonuclease InsQ/TnpB family protein n=1 Tax=Fischerella thermalis TaxID=372787 RepID=UPI0019DAB135|nr:transposase [Fischerella thermalis]MBF1988750.1 IS200/IS605 family element transposase accessory protein TnpB [Fischerella thermalis M58_A2018_009]MBF2059404.1 IS200/IS605 family element transposase accessory protein TnpB [Fischerella thermalis M66_A2018_004]MBF2072129.1 IS200/IS605 family element transposase accessory protein TnpB [Fischerella thermalis M48_A2018_028]
MRVVDRHVINRNHEYWREADELAFKSKNLYNAANYFCRQYFFETGSRYTLPTLYHLVKNTESYRALPTKVSKQIIKKLIESWKSYFEAHKDWKKHPNKYKSEPRIPRYKDKTKGRNIVIYHHESIYKADLKQGRCHLSMSNISVPTKAVNIAEARIVPSSNCYVLEIVYEIPESEPIEPKWVAGIDLGVDNLVALTSNQPGFRPLLVNGRPLKSRNQYYNKLKAKLQSHLTGVNRTSRRIQSLAYHRNRYVENYLHNTSRLIVDLLLEKGIGTLVIGKNDGWKQEVNMGKQNNQKFVNIPHAKLISQIAYKCELVGIKVVIQEESYTSKTSALDLEPPCKQSEYAGKRVKRGLFKSKTGCVINADVNGSIQIIRKYLPEAFTAEGVVSCAVQPLLVNLA